MGFGTGDHDTTYMCLKAFSDIFENKKDFTGSILDFGAGSGLYPRLTAGNAEEMQKTLMLQRVDPDSDGPQRVFGSNWPYASTLWWYIKTGMPHQAPMSLTTEEVYALSAYILYINEMSIDGVEVDDEYVFLI